MFGRIIDFDHAYRKSCSESHLEISFHYSHQNYLQHNKIFTHHYFNGRDYSEETESETDIYPEKYKEFFQKNDNRKWTLN